MLGAVVKGVDSLDSLGWVGEVGILLLGLGALIAAVTFAMWLWRYAWYAEDVELEPPAPREPFASPEPWVNDGTRADTEPIARVR